MIFSAEEEIKKLRKALEFYAEGRHYVKETIHINDIVSFHTPPDFVRLLDDGAKARVVLNETN